MSGSSFAALAIVAVVLALNFLTMPAEEYRGDAEAVRIETVTLLNEGKWAVPEKIAAEFGAPGQYFYKNAAGARYPKYGVLNTLIYLPALALERVATGALSFDTEHTLWLNLLNLVFSGLTALYLVLLVRRYTAASLVVWIFVLASLYATFWWNYLRAHGFEIYLTLFTIAFYFHFTRARETQSARHFFGAGLFLGLLLLAKTVFVIWLPVAAVVLLLDRGKLRRAGLAYGSPVLLALALLLLTNWWKFGSPWTTGYTQWEQESAPFTADARPALWGYLFSNEGSIFLYYPVLAAALAGWPAFLKKFRGDAVMAAGLALTLFFVCLWRTEWRGTSCFGPRYLLPVLPLVSLPFVEVLEWFRQSGVRSLKWTLGGLLGLGLAGSFILQVAVNSLPFFFWNDLLAVAGNEDSKATRYLAAHQCGTAHAGFLGYVRGGSPAFATGFVNELDPAALARLEALTAETRLNYFWFRYSVEKKW